MSSAAHLRAALASSWVQPSHLVKASAASTVEVLIGSTPRHGCCLVSSLNGVQQVAEWCQGVSETENVSRPSAHGTPTDLRNRCSRGWVPAECLEQKMLYAYATVCTQGDFTLSRK